METALIYLGFKGRTEQEVRQKLLDRGFETSEIDTTLVKLKEWKYVDDDEFAKSYIRSRSLSRPQSAKMLTYELKKKGITGDTSEIDDLEQARTALAKKKNLKTYEQQVRFLASRGFSWDVIGKLVKKEYN